MCACGGGSFNRSEKVLDLNLDALCVAASFLIDQSIESSMLINIIMIIIIKFYEDLYFKLLFV